MADRILKTRVQNKNDTSANWKLATNFKPLKGEMILYTDTKQIKVGDGNTLVNDLPLFTDSIASLNENIIRDSSKTYLVWSGASFPDSSGISSFKAPANSVIDWGDGVIETFATASTVTNTHTYDDNINIHLISISGLTSIDSGAFTNCQKLKNIIIADNILSIGPMAFNNCYGLTSAIIPNNVTSIGNLAFSSCQNLINIDIGAGVTSIGTNAFQNCDKLASITFESKTPITYTSNMLPNTIEKIIVPKSATTAYKTAIGWTNFADKIVYEIDSSDLIDKQDVLVSGTNIKTINGESVLGSGDITIEGGDVTAAGNNVFTGANTFDNDLTIANEKVLKFTATDSSFYNSQLDAQTLRFNFDPSKSDTPISHFEIKTNSTDPYIEVAGDYASTPAQLHTSSLRLGHYSNYFTLNAGDAFTLQSKVEDNAVTTLTFPNKTGAVALTSDLPATPFTSISTLSTNLGKRIVYTGGDISLSSLTKITINSNIYDIDFNGATLTVNLGEFALVANTKDGVFKGHSHCVIRNLNLKVNLAPRSSSGSLTSFNVLDTFGGVENTLVTINSTTTSTAGTTNITLRGIANSDHISNSKVDLNCTTARTTSICYAYCNDLLWCRADGNNSYSFAESNYLTNCQCLIISGRNRTNSYLNCYALTNCSYYDNGTLKYAASIGASPIDKIQETNTGKTKAYVWPANGSGITPAIDVETDPVENTIVRRLSDGRVRGQDAVDNNDLTTLKQLNGKQDALISGTNIKTINGESILGSGNLTVSGGISYEVVDLTSKSTVTDEQLTILTASEFNKVKYGKLIYDLHEIDGLNRIYTSNYLNSGSRVTVNTSTKAVTSGSLNTLTSISPYVKNNLDYNVSDTIYALSAYQGNILNGKIGNKQDTLVSGTNIKTINGESILGEGDLEISGGGSGGSETLYRHTLQLSGSGPFYGFTTIIAKRAEQITSLNDIKSILGNSFFYPCGWYIEDTSTHGFYMTDEAFFSTSETTTRGWSVVNDVYDQVTEV